MLDQLVGRWSNRKLRLLAVACCRRIDHLLFDDRLWALVNANERFADGEIGQAELDAARAAARKVVLSSPQPSGRRYVGGAVLLAAARQPTKLRWVPHDLLVAVSRAAAWHRYVRGRPQPFDAAAVRREKGPFCDLIRDVFGNPFRPVALEPAWLGWRGGLPAALARRLYESRDFGEMPVLADMLQDAGCADEQVLGHCRGPGPHVRGCFLVDLLLGKK
jgi:hypothetical protein